MTDYFCLGPVTMHVCINLAPTFKGRAARARSMLREETYAFSALTKVLWPNMLIWSNQSFIEAKLGAFTQVYFSTFHLKQAN